MKLTWSANDRDTMYSVDAAGGPRHTGSALLQGTRHRQHARRSDETRVAGQIRTAEASCSRVLSGPGSGHRTRTRESAVGAPQPRTSIANNVLSPRVPESARNMRSILSEFGNNSIRCVYMSRALQVPPTCDSTSPCNTINRTGVYLYLARPSQRLTEAPSMNELVVDAPKRSRTRPDHANIKQLSRYIDHLHALIARASAPRVHSRLACRLGVSQTWS